MTPAAAAPRLWAHDAALQLQRHPAILFSRTCAVACRRPLSGSFARLIFPNRVAGRTAAACHAKGTIMESAQCPCFRAAAAELNAQRLMWCRSESLGGAHGEPLLIDGCPDPDAAAAAQHRAAMAGAIFQVVSGFNSSARRSSAQQFLMRMQQGARLHADANWAACRMWSSSCSHVDTAQDASGPMKATITQLNTARALPSDLV